MSALNLDRLEKLEVSPEEFDHAAHVEMAWLYLRETPPETAEARFIATLRRITRHFGMPERYHETITRAFWLLIAERYRRDPDAAWSTFAGMNPELFDRRLLHGYYSRERLGSDEARRHFLLPEPQGLGDHGPGAAGP